MNNVEQLNNFLQRITTDVNLTTSHIGICTALVVVWINSGFKNPIGVSRKRLMCAAKIKSTSTYHKILADLIAFKYIEYIPSFHPVFGSQISIL
jgi:hypothetical protein